MPWKLVHNHPACHVGEWAVINMRAEAEGRHSIEGCHATRDEALAQQRALYAKEPQMSLRQLTVSIESKDVTDVGSGEITGLAAVYGNVDLQDDMVEGGAANKTVSDWSRAKSRVPLLDWHGDSISRIIGSVSEMKSVPQGVWFRAGFTKDEQGQRARQLAKDGFLTGVSIGYQPVRQSMKMIGDRMVRVLHEIRIHEISLTPVPANPEAQLASVKSLDSDGKAATAPYGNVPYADPGYQDDGQKRYPLDTEEHCRAAWSYINQADNAAKYSADELRLIKGRIRAALAKYGVQVNASLDFPTFSEMARKALEIGHEVAAKAAFDALLSDYTMAAGPVDEPPTADDAAPTDLEPAGDTSNQPDDAAAYALALIAPPGPRDGAPNGKPPTALAYPQQLLNVVETANQQADLDQLEAEINQALGRAG